MGDSSVCGNPPLFHPLQLGALELSHRVVLAPLTRNRGTPSSEHQRTWYPDALNALYYSQRATPGGLLITEAVPISQRTSGTPGVPGIFTLEQQRGWKTVVDSVHAKQGLILCQLWHQGRAAHSRMTGLQTWSSSPVPIQGSLFGRNGQSPIPHEVPREMSVDDIQEVHNEYIVAARAAMECGFDGIELHAANGYLPDQFHHSNINIRMDSYGGSLENRCRFTIELVQKLCNAVGSDRIGVRISPYGLFNETRGTEREQQWTYLCSQLSHLQIAYIHLIEPRFDEMRAEDQKLAFLRSSVGSSEELSLSPFHAAIASPTKCIVAGGYHWGNCWQGIERGDHDAIAFGRYFISNDDLVERLRSGQRLYKYDRATFYGPFEKNEIGYTIHPKREWAEERDLRQAQNVGPESSAVRASDAAPAS